MSERSPPAADEALSPLEAHGDDGDDLGDLGPQASLEAVAQRRQLSRATCTGAQQRHLDRAVLVDLDELYIASVGDQGGPQTIQHALYGVPERMSDTSHDPDVIGSSAVYAERSLSLREPRGSFLPCG